MSLEVFGDGGDVDDLLELASRSGYALCADGLWRETDDEQGLTDDQMWEYVEDRRQGDINDILIW
jgi:hypothetical protein